MTTEKLTIRISARFMTTILKIGLGVVVIGFSFHFFRGLHTKYIAKEVEGFMRSGMPALAFEQIDPYRDRFVTEEGGCALILRVYIETRRLEKVEWAVESCLYRGIKTYDTLMGRVHVLMNSQQTEAGIAALRGAKKYQRWEANTRLVSSLMRAGRSTEALSEMAEALKSYPDVVPVHAFAMRFYSDTGHWPEAAKEAQFFKQQAIDGKVDEGFKAHVAKVFEKTGDMVSARRVLGQ